MELLKPSTVTVLEQRFNYFGDGIIAKCDLTWRPAASCVLEILAMDNEANYEWKRVVLVARNLSAFYWHMDWRGSIECAELFVTHFDGRFFGLFRLKRARG
jgi:hypothetical protein